MNEAPPAHCGVGFDPLGALVGPRQQVVERAKPPSVRWMSMDHEWTLGDSLAMVAFDHSIGIF